MANPQVYYGKSFAHAYISISYCTFAESVAHGREIRPRRLKFQCNSLSPFQVNDACNSFFERFRLRSRLARPSWRNVFLAQYDRCTAICLLTSTTSRCFVCWCAFSGAFCAKGTLSYGRHTLLYSRDRAIITQADTHVRTIHVLVVVKDPTQNIKHFWYANGTVDPARKGLGKAVDRICVRNALQRCNSSTGSTESSQFV